MTRSRPATLGWVLTSLAVLALATLLHFLGRTALTSPDAAPVHETVRMGALVFSVAYALGQGWAFRRLAQAARDDTRVPGELRPLVLGLLKRLGYGALALSVLALLAWAPLFPRAGAWPVLFAAEVMATFLAVAVGLAALCIRACLDYAARAEGDPTTVLLFVRFGFILLALGYLTAHWLRPLGSQPEVLVTNLGLAAALLLLGLNRLDTLPASALTKLR